MNDVVNGEIPSGSIDVQRLAEEMTDVEFKALAIENFRMLQEILGFVRDVNQAIASASQNGGVMGRMLGGILPPMATPGISPATLEAMRASGLSVPPTGNGKR